MKPHQLQRLIHQFSVIIYALVFIAVSLVCVYYSLSTGNIIIDVAIIGLVSGLISYEIAYWFGNNRKRHR